MQGRHRPLVEASSQGHVGLVNTLLRFKADVNATTKVLRLQNIHLYKTYNNTASKTPICIKRMTTLLDQKVITLNRLAILHFLRPALRHTGTWRKCS